MLICKYAENIEVVDPMLRNNQELVDVMGDVEKAWSVAKDQIFETEKCQHLQMLSHSIESSAYKYKAFSELVENCDSDIFIAIPCLAVLKSLTSDDNSLCRRFLPKMFQEGEDSNRKF